jgi:hypothetical protein
LAGFTFFSIIALKVRLEFGLNLFLFVILIIIFQAGAHADSVINKSTSGVITPVISFDKTVYVVTSGVNDFSNAVTSAGNKQATLIVSSPQTIFNSLIIPSNIKIKIIDKGTITINRGQTLIINGNFEAASHKVFNCIANGRVKFNSNIRSYPQWFGATGNGADDTIAIQMSVDAAPSGTVVINRKFFVNGTANSTYSTYGGIRFLSNQTIIFEGEGALQLIPTASAEYAILRCEGVNNIKIVNPNIAGDGVQHSGRTGEWGMGIFIVGCKNIQITGGMITNCWGDGIYIGHYGVNTKSNNITVSKVTIENCRRQGISVVGANDIKIISCNFNNIRGTNPQSGVDFEPNLASFPNSNAIVRNNKFDKCMIGVLVANAYNNNINIFGNTIRAGRGIQYASGATNINVTNNNITVIPFPTEETAVPSGLYIYGFTNGGSLHFANNNINLAAPGRYTKLINSRTGNFISEYHITDNNFNIISKCTTSTLASASNSEFSRNTITVSSNFDSSSLISKSILTFLGNGWTADGNRFINNSVFSVRISLADGVNLLKQSTENYFSSNFAPNNKQLSKERIW